MNNEQWRVGSSKRGLLITNEDLATTLALKWSFCQGLFMSSSKFISKTELRATDVKAQQRQFAGLIAGDGLGNAARL